jgi:hypothetical protein
MLDLLAEDSSDAAPAGALVVAPLPEADTTLDTQKPVSTRPRRPCRANQPDPSADEQKKKKDASGEYPVWIGTLVPRFLLLKKCLRLDLLMLTPMGVPNFAADPNMGAPSIADPNGGAACVANVDDEEEENEIPLTRKNSRQFIASGESSGVHSPALSALIGLQELSLANFDQTLEDMVPEDLLSEPVDDGAMEVCADVPDAGLRSSRASSTLERDLEGRETDLVVLVLWK